MGGKIDWKTAREITDRIFLKKRSKMFRESNCESMSDGRGMDTGIGTQSRKNVRVGGRVSSINIIIMCHPPQERFGCHFCLGACFRPG